MKIQEIWEIKEKVSEKIYGKSAEEINAILKPSVEETTRRIEEIRQEKSRQSRHPTSALLSEQK